MRSTRNALHAIAIGGAVGFLFARIPLGHVDAVLDAQAEILGPEIAQALPVLGLLAVAAALAFALVQGVFGVAGLVRRYLAPATQAGRWLVRGHRGESDRAVAVIAAELLGAPSLDHHQGRREYRRAVMAWERDEAVRGDRTVAAALAPDGRSSVVVCTVCMEIMVHIGSTEEIQAPVCFDGHRADQVDVEEVGRDR